MLFQAKDRKPLRSDQIDYDFFRENDLNPESMEMVFFRPLKEVVPRIEPLGFTLNQVRNEYANCAETWLEERQAKAYEEDELVVDVMN